MKRQVISRDVKKFLLEMFPVVLGILLAFMINNWSEAHKGKKDLKVAKAHIIQEIIGNYNECQKTVRIQKIRNRFFSVYRDSLDKFSAKNHFLAQLPFEGVNVPTISRTAWDAASYSGVIAQLNFEELQMLTSIYQMQNIFSDVQNQLLEIVYSTDMYKPESLKSTFYSLNRINDDFVDFAKGISNAYRVYFEEYVPTELEKLAKDNI